MDPNTLRSRQLNPCDHLYWKSRGYPERPWNWKQILENTGSYNDDSSSSEEDYYDSPDFYDSFEQYYSDDEHCQRSNANNPNNDEYWRARGWPRRPNDWRERVWGGNVNHQRIQKPSRNTGSTSNKSALTEYAVITSVFLSDPNDTQTTQSYASGFPKTGNVTKSTTEKVPKSLGINIDRTSPAA